MKNVLKYEPFFLTLKLKHGFLDQILNTFFINIDNDFIIKKKKILATLILVVTYKLTVIIHFSILCWLLCILDILQSS